MCKSANIRLLCSDPEFPGLCIYFSLMQCRYSVMKSVVTLGFYSLVSFFIKV